MKLLMLSGDRDTVRGLRGPFYYMQEVFSRHWERIDVLVPPAGDAAKANVIHDRVHFHPARGGRFAIAREHAETGSMLFAAHRHDAIVSHDYGSYYNGRAAARIAKKHGAPWMSELFHVPGVPRAANWLERVEPSICKYYVRFAMRAGVGAFRVMNHHEMPPFLRACGVPERMIRTISALYLDFNIFHPRAGAGKIWDIVYVGRMVANKGVATIVDALAAVKQQFPALRARFVGTGPARAAWEARAARLGLQRSIEWVDWLETKEDLAELYRSARLLVCASYNEGGPRVTCEAMACGTPVVSTPIGVMPDLIQSGVNGWLYPFDAASLANCIKQALGDPGAYARAASRCAGAVAPFEFTKTIGLYAEGIQQLAREARGGAR